MTPLALCLCGHVAEQHAEGGRCGACPTCLAFRPATKAKKLLPRRQYSREYSVTVGKGEAYHLSAIPPGLWKRVRAKARRERLSIRALILGLLDAWERGAVLMPGDRVALDVVLPPDEETPPEPAVGG